MKYNFKISIFLLLNILYIYPSNLYSQNLTDLENISTINKLYSSDVLLNFNPQSSSLPIIEYGPLTIYSSKIFKKNNVFILPGYNLNKSIIFIAINCRKNKINVTDENFIWKEWLSPQLNFEKYLFDDICS